MTTRKLIVYGALGVVGFYLYQRWRAQKMMEKVINDTMSSTASSGVGAAPLQTDLAPNPWIGGEATDEGTPIGGLFGGVY